MTISIDCYVSLDTESPLEKEAVRAWFACVKDNLSSGLMRTAQTVGDDGSLRPVALVVRQSGGRYNYIVPLVRNLSDIEGEKLTSAYGETSRDLDYAITASSTLQELDPDAETITVDDARYAELCGAWAKRQHDQWMTERLAAGWRYGETMSMANRTHPMLRAWSELPIEQKGVDVEAPARMVQLLNDEGYVIISRGELDAIRNLLRQQS